LSLNIDEEGERTRWGKRGTGGKDGVGGNAKTNIYWNIIYETLHFEFLGVILSQDPNQHVNNPSLLSHTLSLLSHTLSLLVGQELTPFVFVHHYSAHLYMRSLSSIFIGNSEIERFAPIHRTGQLKAKKC